MKSKLKAVYGKYMSIPIAAKAAMWFVFCTLLQKCISFITVPIFTRLMPTAEYGLYSTYMSWYSIIVVFCTLNIHTCVYINGVAKAKNEKEKDAIAVPLLSLIEVITLVCFIIYTVFHKWLDKIIGLPSVMVYLMFAQILFEAPMNFWTYKQRFEFKYISLVIRTISLVVCNAALGIIFVILSDKNQALARVFSIVVVQAVFGGVFYLYFFKRGKKIFACRNWRHALKVQLPLVPHGLSVTVLSSADRIMISNLVGAAEAGIYSVAYSAGYIMNVLKSSITDSLRPWIYTKIKEKAFDDVRIITKPILLLIMIITFIFIALAPEIISIMAPSQYYEAIYVIPPVAASSFFTFLYNTFSAVSFYFEKTNKIMLASVSGAVMNLVLNAVCIPVFGYIAAGYTTLFCYMFFSFAHYLIMRKLCKDKLNGKSLFDMKFIIILSCVVIAMTVVFNFIYTMMLVRYALVLLLCAVLFLKRESFIKPIRMLRKKK